VTYTHAMYGYGPQKPDQEPGSWGEIAAMTRVIFIELAKPLSAIALVLFLVITTVFLLFSNPVYAIVPGAIIAGLSWWLIRRDREAIREAQDSLPPHR
jgi:hypothetical protein